MALIQPYTERTCLFQEHGVWDPKAEVCVGDEVFCKRTYVGVMASVGDTSDSLLVCKHGGIYRFTGANHRSREITSDDLTGGERCSHMFV